MKSFLPLLLVLTALSAPLRAADGDADDKAIRELAVRYYDTLASKDVDAFMALWSQKSSEYAVRKKIMAELYAETGPIQVKSLTVVWVRRNGDAAWMRVRGELLGNDAKSGQPHSSLGKQDRILDLVREDGNFKVLHYLPSDRRLMLLHMAAFSKAERLRLLDDNSDLVGPDFVLMILREAEENASDGEFDVAAMLEDRALEIAAGMGDKPTLAWSHLGRGATLFRQSHHEAALSSYAKALALFREANDRRGEEATLNNIGIAYRMTGRYAEALQQHLDCLKIDRELGQRAEATRALNQIGAVYEALGRFGEALQPFEDSLKITRDLGDRKGEAGTLNNIGMVYFDTGRYDEALQQYQDSLRIARELADQRQEAAITNNIGNVYQRTGRYGEALRQYQDSLAMKNALGDRQGAAGTLLNIGNAYEDTGRYAEALRQYRESLAISRELGNRPGAADALNNLGNICLDVDLYAEALQFFQDSLSIKRELKDRAGEAHTLINIGAVYRDMGRYPEALQQFQDSLQITRELKDRPGEAVNLLCIGVVYEKTGRYPEALQQFQDGLQIESTLDRLSDIVACQDHLGRIYEARKQWGQAADAYREAIHFTEQLRTNTREPSLQSSLLAQKTDPFFHLAECLLELRRPDEAFAASEQMKARGLVDILQQGKTDLRRGMSDDEKQEEQRLQGQVTALGVQLEDLLNRKVDAQAVAALVGDLDKARQNLEAFRLALYLHRPDLQTRRAEFAPASPADLGRSLFAGRPGLVMLSYLVGSDETLLFVLTPSERDGKPARLTVYRIDIGSKDLAEAVDAFREGCSDPSKGEPDADDLYRWLIAPAAEELAAATQVVFVPDSVLHTLPFQALKGPDGKCLIERFAVSSAPSVTALVKMEELGAKRRQQYAGQPPSLLAVGISDFGRREKPLPAAEQEARTVADAFGDGAKLLPGAKATRARLEASWSGRRYLHFATHGRLNPDAPLYSSLVLSPDGDEGVLYARDLLDADVPAELVVMSACHTGEGRNVAGEGLLGMSWSWFAAGVPSVVASQWSVGDASTARLMKAFYARLRADDSKAEALRQAELSLLADPSTHHPFYWAPFVLVGDDR